MSWPIKYRALSFIVTVGVNLGEALIIGGPVALVAWIAGLATLTNAALWFAFGAALWSLGIGSYTHIAPPASGPNGSARVSQMKVNR